MLLVHQTGSVKLGEVVRYTLTYTPSQDRIVPTAPQLYVKVRNTSAIALRAAYLRGPYTLYAACYPASFDPNRPHPEPETHGYPQFEPNLKAGGSWGAQLQVPDQIRETFGENRRQSYTGKQAASPRASADDRRLSSSGGRGGEERSTSGHAGSTEAPSAPSGGSVTWIIEISSQVLFSTSAGVNYEILVGRNERAVDGGLLGSNVAPAASGTLADFQERRKHHSARPGMPQPNGVYTRAIHLTLSDTAALWNTPQLPGEEQGKQDRAGLRIDPTADRKNSSEEQASQNTNKGRTNPVLSDADPTSPHETQSQGERQQLESDSTSPKKQDRQRIHLVLITHGLHGSLGADMLFLKESIDTAAKQARMDRSMRRAKQGQKRTEEKAGKAGKASSGNDQTDQPDQEDAVNDLDLTNEFDDAEDEQVIVRGFPGNAVRTERGIQYLGKRLAKYVLAMTYPDQPYVPVKKKSMARTFTSAFGGGSGDKDSPAAHHGQETHHHSTVRREPIAETSLAYQITSISFVGHSLGGLVQTYAIAYIQKHSPEFFDLIKPINFIALASPFLGLSNENPLYVKFALDFGLVGRTGQDLGLTWRAPTMVRSGWGAMIGGIGSEGQRRKSQMEPGSKPLLRILPAGPAHTVLRRFRNRTLYSNVVNDGIVPLRTSCLLFLDWRGLGRVDKARRENGLVGTMAGWGWAEIMGQNSTEQHHVHPRWSGFNAEDSNDDPETSHEVSNNDSGAAVPQPDDDAIADHTNISAPSSPIEERRGSLHRLRSNEDVDAHAKHRRSNSDAGSTSPFAGFFALLRPGGGSSSSSSSKDPTKPHHKVKSPTHEAKAARIYKRSQTLKVDDDDLASGNSTPHSRSPVRPGMARGESALVDQNVIAPPKTSVFESAGDILNPPLPPKEYICDPLRRPRTIFHDRVYHPEDIPPPPVRPRSFLRRSTSHESGAVGKSSTQSSLATLESTSSGASVANMKVEEKIARAYHRDLSWRKVLVRLEPDAHNNIVVRRMFANAYGWPVVKHLCDTHFADSAAATLPDVYEAGRERAKPMHALPGGAEVTAPRRRESQTGEEEYRFGLGNLAPKGTSTDSAEADLPGPPPKAVLAERPRGEAADQISPLPDMTASHHSSMASRPRQLSRQDSAQWDDRFFDSDEDDDSDDDAGAFQAARSPQHIAMEAAKVLDPRKEGKGNDGTQEANPGTKHGKPGTKQDVPDGMALPNLGGSSGTATGTSKVEIRKSVEEHMGWR